MQYEAFRFENDEDLLQVLQDLDRLPDVPVEYDVVAGSTVLVIPSRLLGALRVIIESRSLKVDYLKTAPFASLSPKKQWELRRGHLHNRKSA